MGPIQRDGSRPSLGELIALHEWEFVGQTIQEIKLYMLIDMEQESLNF
jgi:hypothetical protein